MRAGLVALALAWLAASQPASGAGVAAAAGAIGAALDARWEAGDEADRGWLARPSARAEVHARSGGGPVQAALGLGLADPGRERTRRGVVTLAVVVAFAVAVASLLAEEVVAAPGARWRELGGLLCRLFLGLLAAAQPGWIYGAGRFAQDAIAAGVRSAMAAPARAAGAEVAAVLARERGVLEAVARRAGAFADEEVGPVLADGLRSHASRLEAAGADPGLADEVARLVAGGPEGRVSAAGRVMLVASRERPVEPGTTRVPALGRFPGSGTVPSLGGTLAGLVGRAESDAWDPARDATAREAARRACREATLAHVDALLLRPALGAALPRLAEDPTSVAAWLEDRRGPPVDLSGGPRATAAWLAEGADLVLRGLVPLAQVAVPGLMLECLAAFAGLVVAWSLLPAGRVGRRALARAAACVVLLAPALALAGWVGDGCATALLGVVMPSGGPFLPGPPAWLLGALASGIAAGQVLAWLVAAAAVARLARG